MMFYKFLLLIFLAASSVSTLAQAQSLVGPSLQLEVLGTELRERSDGYSIEAKLRLTITNKTNRKILLIDKYAWVWEKNVYRKEADSKLTRVFSQGSGISY